MTVYHVLYVQSCMYDRHRAQWNDDMTVRPGEMDSFMQIYMHKDSKMTWTDTAINVILFTIEKHPSLFISSTKLPYWKRVWSIRTLIWHLVVCITCRLRMSGKGESWIQKWDYEYDLVLVDCRTRNWATMATHENSDTVVNYDQFDEHPVPHIRQASL